MAFKSSHYEESEEESEEEEEDIAKLTHTFKKFLKKENFKKQKGFSRNLKGEYHKNHSSSKRYEVVCYGCRRPGHILYNCPSNVEGNFIAKEKKKGKRQWWQHYKKTGF